MDKLLKEISFYYVMVNRQVAKDVLRTYEEAWVNQDPNKILTIFTEDATYHERILQKPFVGHKEIY